MFEQPFKNIDNTLHHDAGCVSAGFSCEAFDYFKNSKAKTAGETVPEVPQVS